MVQIYSGEEKGFFFFHVAKERCSKLLTPKRANTEVKGCSENFLLGAFPCIGYHLRRLLCSAADEEFYFDLKGSVISSN